MFVLPDLGGDGVYGIRLDQPREAPVFARVNLPEVWWTLTESPSANPENPGRVDVESATAGAQLRLFGRCLTYGGVALSVSLTSSSGKTVNLQSKNEGSFALTTTLLHGDDLRSGQLYTLEVRPGRGRQCSIASAPRVVQIHAVRWKPTSQILTWPTLASKGIPTSTTRLHLKPLFRKLQLWAGR